MEDCKTCKTISVVMGKKIMMPLLGHKYSKTTLENTQQHFEGLDLDIVGGLKKRGWTLNDVDVIGDRTHIEVLSVRLVADGILNPIHYCGKRSSHSHLQCIYYGIKLVLMGKGY